MADEAVAETPVESEPVINPSWADAEREAKEAVAESTPAPQPDEGQTSAEKPNGISKRIDELTAEKYTLKGRAEAAEKELNYWREQVTKGDRPPEPAAVEEVPPKLADYGYDEDKYREAVLDFARKVARTEGSNAAREEVRKAEAEREARDRQKTFQEREEEFIKANPEYVDKVKRNDDLHINKVMAGIITNRPNGLDIALYLGRHPDIAEQISKLSEMEIAEELGALRALVGKPKSVATAAPRAEEPPAPPPPPPIKVSEAPPPPPKLEAVDPGIAKSPNEMTDKEFAKWRRPYLRR